MSRCANTEALNAHLDKEERREKAYDRLEKELHGEMLIVKQLVENMKRIASDYEGFDFSDDVEEMLNEFIG